MTILNLHLRDKTVNNDRNTAKAINLIKTELKACLKSGNITFTYKKVLSILL